MAQPGLSDSPTDEAPREQNEGAGRWLAKTLVLSGAFVLVVAVLVVVGRTVFERIEEHRQNAELAKHPWWDGTVTAEDVDHIVYRIAALEADEDAERTGSTVSLMIYRSGKVEIVPCGYWAVRGHPETHVGFLWRGDWALQVWALQVFPGEGGRGKPLSRREVRALLRRMLDEANQVLNIGSTYW